MLVSQLLVDPGDRVVEVVPLWPNLQEIPRILGATVDTVALRVLARRLAAGPGAAARRAEARHQGALPQFAEQPDRLDRHARGAASAILEHCRRHGIWIFADDAYERLYYEGNGVAPSFLDLAEPDDRVISTNTFSKTWLMTGWRLGWLVVPPALEADLGKLIEYNTSCAPVFVQRAGIAAVTQGEPVIAHTLERFRRARDFLVRELNAIAGRRGRRCPRAPCTRSSACAA